MTDQSLLVAALHGYEFQRAELEKRVAEIHAKLNGHTRPFVQAVSRPARKKHRMGAEGRARISEAQKRRWAAAKKGVARKAAPVVRKRRISAEQRAALLERLKKARSARAAKRTQGEKVPF